MTRQSRVSTAGVLLGIGLGGFVDGIVLHQIAQWHQMLSSIVPPDTMDAMKRNMMADGGFHAAVWIATFAGVLVLWSAVRGPGALPPTRHLLGSMLLGWGAFNLVEGIVDHHVLQLHHVRDLPQHVPAYDWIFLLAGGIGFILIGIALRAGRRGTADYGAERRSGRERRFSYR
ncbi:MAG TPA: DUF2243 domain-containing protein [Burkholderiales bacterium]